MLQLNPSPTIVHATGTFPSPSLAPGERRFHLFVESTSTARARGVAASAELVGIELPAGVSYLTPAATPPVPVVEPPAEPALVLEPVRVGGRASLLVASPVELRARVNGAPVPILALLRVGDRLQVGELALHVSEYRDSRPTPPRAEQVGSPCGVCRLPIDVASRVYTCDCGVVLHLEGEPKPEGERLECARFGDCPSCGAPVRPECGHIWLPEL